MEGAPKSINKIELKEEIKNLQGIDFVFSENPELKKIALKTIEPSFEDKKNIFGMLRGALIDTVRDTQEYEKYNGKTLAVDSFSEESFELLSLGLEENNIDIKPQLDNLHKTLNEQINQGVIPKDADVMDYFNPSTGTFSAFTSGQEKESALQNTEHSIELLNYLETKDQKAKEIYRNYLETIFPESMVKDIMYHGSPRDGIDNFFSPESEGYEKQETTTTGAGGIYFADSYEYALKYTDITNPNSDSRVDENNKLKKGKVYSTILNIKKPITIANKVTDGHTEGLGKATMWNIRDSTLNSLRKNGIDGMIAGEYMINTEGFKEIVIFDPEQIHILGSQKDQEMFKEFTEKDKNYKKVTITIGNYETGATVDSSVYEDIPTTELSINEIVRLEPESKMESDESSKIVQEVVNIINQGKKNELPPILVRAIENGYRIIDGHHRYEAYIQTNIETISVKIIPESEIKIIYKKDSDIESPLGQFGISSLDEFQEKFFESDQELMKTGNFDYKNTELLNNQMKDYLEKIDNSQISKQAKQKQAEMLWLWYHHAAQDAKERYQENKKSIEFIDKALEYREASGIPNEITGLLSLLYKENFEEARSYIKNMDDTKNEQQKDGSIQKIVNYEKETARQLFEYYKPKN